MLNMNDYSTSISTSRSHPIESQLFVGRCAGHSSVSVWWKANGPTSYILSVIGKLLKCSKGKSAHLTHHIAMSACVCLVALVQRLIVKYIGNQNSIDSNNTVGAIFTIWRRQFVSCERQSSHFLSIKQPFPLVTSIDRSHKLRTWWRWNDWISSTYQRV